MGWSSFVELPELESQVDWKDWSIYLCTTGPGVGIGLVWQYLFSFQNRNKVLDTNVRHKMRPRYVTSIFWNQITRLWLARSKRTATTTPTTKRLLRVRLILWLVESGTKIFSFSPIHLHQAPILLQRKDVKSWNPGKAKFEITMLPSCEPFTKVYRNLDIYTTTFKWYGYSKVIRKYHGFVG